MIGAQDLALAVESQRAKSRANPLAHYSYASGVHRRVVELLSAGIETHHRAAGFGGKTRGGAAAVVAWARCERELAGVKLPTFTSPQDITVLVPGYAQQIDSSQKALTDTLGDLPWEPHFLDRGRNIMSAISVECRFGTSRIHFVSQENANVGMVKGQRRHLGWMDEPGREEFWAEVLKNHRYNLITETPLKRPEWDWIQKRFSRAQLQPNEGRCEVVSTLFDNKFLTKEKIDELLQKHAGSDYYDALVYGLYCDTQGASPWGKAGFRALQQMLPACWDGPLRKWKVATSRTDGRIEDVTVEMEHFYDYEPGEIYYVTADLSSGAQSDEHDTAGVDVFAMRRPRQVASWEGYLSPYGTGVLAARAAEYYNGGKVDFDRRYGGDAFMLGVRSTGYLNVAHDVREAKPTAERAYGYAASEMSRASHVASASNAILQGSIEIASRRGVQCLIDCRDVAGKIEARPGYQDTFLSNFSRFAYVRERWREPAPDRAPRMSRYTNRRDKERDKEASHDFGFMDG